MWSRWSGLGIAIDYSLFIVTRFREELGPGHSVEDALATTMATAGRAIMFSGLTVAIGLCRSALLHGNGAGLDGRCRRDRRGGLRPVRAHPAPRDARDPRTARQQHPRPHPAAEAVRPGRRGTAWQRGSCAGPGWCSFPPSRSCSLPARRSSICSSPTATSTQLPATAEARQGADLLQAAVPAGGPEHHRGCCQFSARRDRPVPPTLRPPISWLSASPRSKA